MGKRLADVYGLSSEQENELKTAITKYNDIIRKQAKNNPHKKEHLPERITYSEVLESLSPSTFKETVVETNGKIERKLERVNTHEAINPIDIQRKIESLTNVKHKLNIVTNEATGLVTTEYEIEEAKRNIEIVNEFKERAREKIEPSTSRGTIHSLYYENLKPIEVDVTELKPEQFKKFTGSIAYQSTEASQLEMNRIYLMNLQESISKAYPEISNEVNRMIEEKDLMNDADKLDSVVKQLLKINTDINYVYTSFQSTSREKSKNKILNDIRNTINEGE